MFTILTEILEGLFKLLFELLSLGFASFSKKKGYHADFGAERTLLSRWNKGFRFGQKSISRKHSYVGALISGMTGSGKTSAVILPTLFAMTKKTSFLIHDPSGELLQLSCGYLAENGYTVHVLNFSNPEVSAGYNPLARVKTPSDIQKIAHMLVTNALGKDSKDPFWSLQATALLSVLIAILKQQPAPYHNLASVRHMLNLLGQTSEDPNAPNPIDLLFIAAEDTLYAEYKSFLTYEPKMLASIAANAKAALQLFSDPAVARVTSTDTFSFEQFRNERTVLFIQNPISSQKYYSVLTSLFFEDFSSYVLSRFPKEEEQDIFLIVDEFSSLKVPVFPLFFANARKHRAGTMAVVQDYNQIVNAYGKADAESIKANCFSKLYFGGASLETTKELEQILGKFEYKDDEGKKQIKPLLTNDELRTMKPDRALLICGSYAPILAHVRPYYKSRRYRAYSAIPAPVMKGSVPDHVPLLPLKTFDLDA